MDMGRENETTSLIPPFLEAVSGRIQFTGVKTLG